MRWGSPHPFTISYAGAMYDKRSPHQFFEGLRAFIERSGVQLAQFRFRWAGLIAGINNLDEVLDRTRVRPYIDFLGQVPHREALRRLCESDAALLIQAPHDAIHIPGKLFEAMGARVPLLALAHPCEVTEIIDRCHAGIVCPHTAESVAAGLSELHRFHTEGTRWQFNEPEVERFSANSAVARLAALFDQANV
jgi:glycosyltransferase involved in cell wall biosynthesis